jgi:hypothetical protein
VAVAALAGCMRRSRGGVGAGDAQDPHPTLDLGPCADGNLVLLLVVLVLTSVRQPLLLHDHGAAVRLPTVPRRRGPRDGAGATVRCLGATASGRLVRRWGITVPVPPHGRCCLHAVGSVPYASGQSAVAGGSDRVRLRRCRRWGGVAVTNAVMDSAPPGRDGAASAFRGAAAGMGTAIGVAGMTSIVILASSASLHKQSVRAGIDPSAIDADRTRHGVGRDIGRCLVAVRGSRRRGDRDRRRSAAGRTSRDSRRTGWWVAPSRLAAGVMFFVVRRRQERRSQDVDRVGDDQGAQGQ